MCWVGSLDAKPIVLTEDKIVYKVGRAYPAFFGSKFRNFYYRINKVPPTIKLRPLFGNICMIERGYHSYESRQRAIESANSWESIGRFKIPKGSIMYINDMGTIVSSDIIYIGL